jgi:2-hydroxycyclohexanecarboxyl-CoA dehydrogenase
VTEQRIAIVTGGASGIGLAIGRRLAADGHAVALCDLNAEAAGEGAATLEKAGGTVIGVGVDVADRDRIAAAVAEVVERLGRPTILVNNAGMSAFGSFMKTTLDAWERVLRVNLTGTFMCCQAVVPHMLEAGWGRIVNISSSSAHSGQPYMTSYVASKAGVIGFTKALALELGPKGITVNTIPPGFIDTPMLRAAEARGELGPGGVDDAIARTPVRRAGRPEDIAHACSFLCSEEAGYVTGQVIGVNGGRNT